MRRRKHAGFASFSPLFLSPLSLSPPPWLFCRWTHDLLASQLIVHRRSGAGIIFLTKCFLCGMVMMQWQVVDGCGEEVEAEMVVWIERERGACHCICSQGLRVNTSRQTIRCARWNDQVFIASPPWLYKLFAYSLQTPLKTLDCALAPFHCEGKSTHRGLWNKQCINF